MFHVDLLIDVLLIISHLLKLMIDRKSKAEFIH